ncbi:MAG: hypothetical protein JRH06_16240 [Deltaproteobacteria bacterium]|nr:hypothetical protein [Deltaproteobacteria bacterium]MBW2139087.1 hypothetical protein [Deltaproteobacteria bacterium]
MLVAISDIHFVDGTAGEHNLPFGAFNSVFLADICSLASEKKAKELKILLLGDIVDLIRSTKWFDVEPEDRPWGEKGLADIPFPRRGSTTERQCMKIFGKVSKKSLRRKTPPTSLPKDTILHKNWETFKLFRDLRRHLSERCDRDLPVEIIYVPGNHDRLCNLYPSLRDAVGDALGVSRGPAHVDGDPEAEWWYRYCFSDRDHGVHARHGHQFDIWNFGGGNDHGREGHLQVAIGDLFTTEFAVKIPWLLERVGKRYRGVTRELVESTKDIDNVRPLSSIMEWIYYRLKREDQGEVRKAFGEVFERIVEDLLDNPLVQQWRSPKTHIDEALRLASNPWMSWLPKGIVGMLDVEDLLPLLVGMAGSSDDPEKDVYTRSAYNEGIWREDRDIHFILYGHTHVPVQRPLDARDREIFYLNTGTWRDRIYKTVALDKAYDFVNLKQMTYTIVFRKDEDPRGKEVGTLSFDVWSGTKKKHYVS